MANKFDITIALRVLAEGVSSFKDVRSELAELSKNSTAASEAFDRLRDFKIGGFSTLANVRNILVELESLAGNFPEIKILAPKTVEEVSFLEKELRNVLNIARSEKDFALFESVSNTLERVGLLKKELNSALEVVNNFSKQRQGFGDILDSAKIASNFGKVKQFIRETTSAIEDAKEKGNAFEIKGKLSSDLSLALGVLESIKKKKIELGQDVTSIDIEILNIRNLKASLESVTEDTDKIARTNFNELNERIGLLNNLVQQSSKEVRELEKGFKEAAKVGQGIAFKDNINKELELILGNLHLIRDEKIKLGVDTKDVSSAISAVEYFKTKLNSLTINDDALAKLNFDSISYSIARASNNVIRLTQYTKDLEKKLEEAKERGESFNIKATLDQSIDLALKELGELKDQHIEFGINQAPINNLLEKLTFLRDKVNAVTESADKLQKEKIELKASLGDNFKKVQEETKAFISNFEKVKSQGNLNVIKTEGIEKVNSLVNKYNELLDVQQRLGNTKEVDLIKVEINRLKRIETALNNIDFAEQRLNRSAVELKINDDNTIEAATKGLKELEKEIEKAKKEGKQIELNASFKAKAADVQEKVDKATPILQKRGQAEAAVKLNNGVTEVKKGLQEIDAAAPKGLLGVLSGLVGRFQNASKAIGGTNGVIRAAAGSFRLMGTAAFLVGGQLRTLGFAGSAIGSLLQNFGPLVVNLITSLGPLGIVLSGIAGAFAILAAQGLVFAGALAKIIQTGLEFNTKFENTKNNIAGLASEFYTFSINGQKVGEGLSDTDAAIARFAVSSQVAEEQVKKLSLEALGTKFTTSELFSAFQATTAALGSLSPSLDKTRELTGKFGLAAGLARIPADELGTSIQQIVAGQGNARNRLQQLFNSLKDSQGIALTADRIRELRAQKGDVLVNELSTALDRLTIASKKANQESFEGVLSNFKDLFELFSGRSTEGLFEILKKGLNEVFGLFFNIEKLKLTEPVEKLINALQPLFNILGNDVIDIVRKIAEYVLSFGEYINENYNDITLIYETAKEIALQIIKIVTDFTTLLGLTNGTGKSLTFINFILITVQVIAASIRVVINGIYGAIVLISRSVITIYGYFVDLVTFIAETAAKVLPSFFSSVTDGTVGLLHAAQDNINSAKETLDTTASEISDNISDATNTLRNSANKAINDAGQAAAKLGEAAKKKGKIDSTANEPAQKKVRGDKEKSVLDAEKALNQAILKLALEREKNQLKLIQDRLKLQQTIVESDLERNIIAQETAARKIAEIRNTDIDNEIKSKRNAIFEIDTLRTDKDKAYFEEAARLRAEEAKKPADEQKTEQLKSKLQEVALKQAADRIKDATEIKQLESDILLLEQSKLTVQRDQLITQLKRSEEARKELAALRLSVAELSNPLSANTLNERINQLIEQRIPQLLKLNAELKNLKVEDFSNLGKDAQKAFEDRKAVIQESIGLLQQELTLQAQRTAFEQADNAVQQQQNRLRDTEGLIQSRLNRGLITRKEAEIQIQAERIKTQEVLKKLLETEEKLAKINAENGIFDENQIEKIRQLKLSIEELGQTINDSLIVKLNQDARSALVDFFDKIQENVGNAKSAFQDLGKSILASFRRLISERIVEELFDKFLTNDGPLGKVAQTIFGSKRQQEAQERANRGLVISSTQKNIADAGKLYVDSFKELQQKLTAASDALAKEIQNLSSPMQAALDGLTKAIIEKATQIKELAIGDIDKTKKEAAGIISKGGKLAGESPFEAGIASELAPATKIKKSLGRADIDAYIEQKAEEFGLDPNFAAELFRAEGGFSIDSQGNYRSKRSSANALGIGQLTAATARRFGLNVSNAFSLDPTKDERLDLTKNLDASFKYLDFLNKLFKGDKKLVAAAYNAGEGAVQKYGGIPPYKETQGYVKRIGKSYEEATGQSFNEKTFAKQTAKNLTEVFDQEKYRAKSAEEGPFNKEYGGFSPKEVASTLGGTVTEINKTEEGFNVTLKNLTNGIEETFNRLQDINVKIGDNLSSGQTIGTTGKNGLGYEFKSSTGEDITGTNLSPLLRKASSKLGGASESGAFTSSGGSNTDSVYSVQVQDPEITTGMETLNSELPTVATEISTLDVTTGSGFSNLTTVINQAASFLNQTLTNILSQIGSSGQNGENTNDLLNSFSDLLNSDSLDFGFKNGGLAKKFSRGGLAGFISGGAVSGKGGLREDAVPAYLSNGEYVMQASVVNMLGKSFFDKLNGYAGGGSIDYSGGGAKLAELAPIVEQKVEVKKPSFLKRLLGFILPFALNFIPGIGPLVSTIAGPFISKLLGGSKILDPTGDALKASLSRGAVYSAKGGPIKGYFLGGLLSSIGGLFSNIFSGSGGGSGIGGFFSNLFSKTGTISKLFGSKDFQSLLFPLLLGGGLGNSKAGQFLPLMLLLLNNKNKKASGGLIKGYFLGGLLSTITGFFSKTATAGGGGFGGFFSNLFSKAGPLSKLGASKGFQEFSLPFLLGGGLGNGGGVASFIPLLFTLFNKNKKAHGGPVKGFFLGGLLAGLGSLFGGGAGAASGIGGFFSKIFGGFGKLFGGGGSGGGGFFSSIGKLFGFGGGKAASGAIPLSDVNLTQGLSNSTPLAKAAIGLGAKPAGPLGAGGGLGSLLGAFGLSSILGKLFGGSGGSSPSGTQQDPPIADPDQARKDRFGSAYDRLISYNAIPAFKYLDETRKKLRKQYGIDEFAGGGHVRGAGTATSDSIPALLSNGEYVIKAASVAKLGVGLLDSINEGRAKFATGGIVGSSIDTIPSRAVSSQTRQNVDNNIQINNILDPKLFDSYLSSTDGERKILNLISRNKKSIDRV